MMIDDAKFERLFGAEVLLRELNEVILAQTPVGVDGEVGLVMDVGETANIVQVWVMKYFALMGECHWENSGQYLLATANVTAVSTLHLTHVRNAITDGTL